MRDRTGKDTVVRHMQLQWNLLISDIEQNNLEKVLELFLFTITHLQYLTAIQSWGGLRFTTPAIGYSKLGTSTFMAFKACLQKHGKKRRKIYRKKRQKICSGGQTDIIWRFLFQFRKSLLKLNSTMNIKNVSSARVHTLVLKIRLFGQKIYPNPSQSLRIFFTLKMFGSNIQLQGRL